MARGERANLQPKPLTPVRPREESHGGSLRRRNHVRQAGGLGLRRLTLSPATFEPMSDEQQREAVLAFVNLLVPHLERRAA